MEITYESICKKLGFRPEDYKYTYSGYEDDSKKSPFDILTLDELDVLCRYLEQTKAQRMTIKDEQC